jgi:hypothetical protein
VLPSLLINSTKEKPSLKILLQVGTDKKNKAKVVRNHTNFIIVANIPIKITSHI